MTDEMDAGIWTEKQRHNTMARLGCVLSSVAFYSFYREHSIFTDVTLSYMISIFFFPFFCYIIFIIVASPAPAALCARRPPSCSGSRSSGARHRRP